MSLHEWFNDIDSPVPRFLILDQPSQAGLPYETRGGGFGSARATLLNPYEAIHSSIESLAGFFQVIVLEHGDLEMKPSAVLFMHDGGAATARNSSLSTKLTTTQASDLVGQLISAVREAEACCKVSQPVTSMTTSNARWPRS
ncbi:DUF3732 domain-containing protein [Streptomyces sp. NBC_01717]|uniref:DUF3732 domain-containing protein n=1 Tax=Streptomyces sp. NBC_01717 TaxID=2975918 RepID=UPI003FCE70EC